jgi:tetratricopeptide (TPR) repeat protein
MSNLKELLNQVSQAMEDGKPEDALALLEGDASAHQDAPPFHFVHGTLLYRLTRLDDAIEAFQKATEVGAPIPEYLSNLAVALIDRSEKRDGDEAKDDLHRAIEALESAVTMGPKLPHTYVNLGSAYLNAGDKDRARENLELALEIDAEFEPAKRGLAEL